MPIRYIGGVAFNPDGSVVDGQTSIRGAVVAGTVAAPVINSDIQSYVGITGIAQAITGITVTGTPTDGQRLTIAFTDNGTARAITYGSQFEASTVALPTTTVINARLDTEYVYNAATQKWRIILKA